MFKKFLDTKKQVDHVQGMVDDPAQLLQEVSFGMLKPFIITVTMLLVIPAIILGIVGYGWSMRWPIVLFWVFVALFVLFRVIVFMVKRFMKKMGKNAMQNMKL